MDFHSSSSLKVQCIGRHVVSFRHMIMVLSQPVSALSPKRCMISGKATNINFILIGLTRPELAPMSYHTLGEHKNHYTTELSHFWLRLVFFSLFFFFFYKTCTSETHVFLIMTHQNVILQGYLVNLEDTQVFFACLKTINKIQ